MSKVNQQSPSSDIVISGGGIVGCLSALALATHTDYTITVIETKALAPSANSKATSTHAGFDARVIALAAESIEYLQWLGVNLQSIQTQSIDSIHVSDKGHLGQVQLNRSGSANNSANKSLGEVVALADLGQYLLAQMLKHSQIKLLEQTNIHHVKRSQDSICVYLESDQNTKDTDASAGKKVGAELNAKLLLICDGGNGKFAQKLGLNFASDNYEQSAIITNVIMQKPHNNQAFERFTSQGPIAFLPMALSNAHNDDHITEHNTQHNTKKGNLGADKSNRAMSVVWCTNNTNTESLLSLNVAEFKHKLETLFGSRLGKIQSVSTRFAYPLRLTQAKPYTTHRAVSLGNAAQSLHPIAGQGFNLGIRDVVDMVKTQLEVSAEQDPGSFQCLQHYKRLRDNDKQDTIQATDTLVRVFSNQYWPLVVSRNAGLHLLNAVAPLKAAFTAFATGKR